MFDDREATTLEKNIIEFLKLKHFAVFGASDKAESPGHKIVQRLSKKGYKVYPVNPRIAKVDSMRCYGTLDEIPAVPQVIVVSVPPEPALEVLKAGVSHGVRRFWIQPGSESDDVLTYVGENGLLVVHSEDICQELGKKL